MGPQRFFTPVALSGESEKSVPQRTIEALPTVDVVVISHDHYDHLDHETIRAFATETQVQFAVPLGVGSHLEYWGVDAGRITELEWWQTTALEGVTLACTPARHFSGRFLGDRNATQWASWSIIGPSHRVFFSGDTAMFPGFAEIGAKYGPFDVTFMESGAYDKSWADVHLGPEQAVQAHQMLRGN